MLRLLSKAPRLHRSFSTDFLKQTSALLQERTKAAFKLEADAALTLKKANSENLPKDGVYKHPYCTIHHPLMIQREDTFRALCELLGPEMVSPHYQSVEEFGRWFNYFFIGLIFTISMRSHNNHAFGYCVMNMMFGMEVWIYTLGMYFARCTVLITPNPWKLLWIKYDMDSMLSNLYELEETRAEEKRKSPIGQIDYLRLHQEYLGMKADMINSYVDTQRTKLKQHLYERTLAILRGTEKMEQDNVNNVLRELLQKALAQIQENATKSDEATLKKAFGSALAGIKKGKMTYVGDPLLPVVQEYLDKFIQDLVSMPEGEMSKALGLTTDQRTVLKSQDERSEQVFLSQAPSIKHPKVLAHPLFQKA